jgi:hypothetical protein
MPKKILMTVSIRGAQMLEYDILRTSDNAILISGLKTPFTTETSVSAWNALILADAPAQRDAVVASLQTNRASHVAAIAAIDAQIADLAGTIT